MSSSYRFGQLTAKNRRSRVTLTADDFATLRAGGTVVKFSCNGGDHEYVLNCSGGAEQPGDPAKQCADDPGFGACG